MRRASFADMFLRPVAVVRPFQHEIETNSGDESDANIDELVLYESESDVDAEESHRSSQNNENLVRNNIYLYLGIFLTVSNIFFAFLHTFVDISIVPVFSIDRSYIYS